MQIAYAIRVSILTHLRLIFTIKVRGILSRSTANVRTKGRYELTAEDLIVAIDAEARNLPSNAYKLLWRLVSLSIQRGSSEVRVSHNWLAEQLGLSREGVARSVRELKPLLTVDAGRGYVTTFTLPPSWFSPQSRLFAGENMRTSDFHMPNFQATDCLISRQPVAKKPGNQLPGFQAPKPNFQASVAYDPGIDAKYPGTSCLDSRQLDSPRLIRNAGARVDRSISSSAEPEGLTGFIDRCLRTVKILPAQQEDAQILSDTLQSYRTACGSDYAYTPEPDETVLARILAIAPIEDLCGVLRTLLTDGVRCGKQDMWFFTVLLQRIHHASPKLTASRYDSMKPKAPSQNENLPGFADELINGTMPKLRRLA